MQLAIILEKNLSIDPNQAQSEKLLGDIFKNFGNNEEAVNRYNKATVINKVRSSYLCSKSRVETFSF